MPRRVETETEEEDEEEEVEYEYEEEEYEEEEGSGEEEVVYEYVYEDDLEEGDEDEDVEYVYEEVSASEEDEDGSEYSSRLPSYHGEDFSRPKAASRASDAGSDAVFNYAESSQAEGLTDLDADSALTAKKEQEDEDEEEGDKMRVVKTECTLQEVLEICSTGDYAKIFIGMLLLATSLHRGKYVVNCMSWFYRARYCTFRRSFGSFLRENLTRYCLAS